LKRLSKTQKAEILEAYQAGCNSNVLAEKYSCTANTINRTVKNLLSDSEYTLLKEKRSKNSNKKVNLVEDEILKEKKDDSEHLNDLILIKEEVSKDERSTKLEKEFDRPEIEKICSSSLEVDDEINADSSLVNQSNNNIDIDIDENNQTHNNNFEEIVPLISSFEFDLDKQKIDFQINNYESLPETVYMIVDKKVELDLQPISDLPEWSFLPDNELERNAILLFSNQRSAKRSCSKNQRVIKIPNTSVFKLSKTYLISKGITRLILEDSIISLDN
tara:strand:- start:206 stop:1030 length:825 start_codon:yes stop_codon:yes gene_type:complete